MNRAVDVLADPQVQHRKLYTDLRHPLFDDPMPSETSPAPYRHIPPADLRPAPMPGEHTREICHNVLALRHRGNRPPDRRGRAVHGKEFTVTSSAPLLRERACLYTDTPNLPVQMRTLAG